MRKLVILIALLIPVTVWGMGLMMSSGSVQVVSGACTWSVVWDAETVTGDTSWTNYSDTGDENGRIEILSSATTGGGSEIRLTFRGSSVTAGSIDDLAICPQSADTEDCASAATNITWDTGSDSKVLSTGADDVTDEMTFSFDSGADYLINYYSADLDMQYLSGSPPVMWQKDNATTDETEIVDVSGYSALVYLEFLVQIEACN